jgi:hypothetical protein
MAVGVQLDFHGVTLEQYDEVAERMGLLVGGPMPGQGLFHWVTKTDDGFRVIDVWPSRETFERFAEQKLVPTYSEIGVTDPPDTQFFDVHNYYASGPWRG